MALTTGALALVLHLPENASEYLEERPGFPGTRRASGGLGGAVARPLLLVVACHGLRASKDSEKYLRRSGESEGLSEAETTVASRVEDVLAVVTFLRGRPGLDGRVGLLGSSMGGFVALHARRAGRARPSCHLECSSEPREARGDHTARSHRARRPLRRRIRQGPVRRRTLGYRLPPHHSIRSRRNRCRRPRDHAAFPRTRSACSSPDPERRSPDHQPHPPPPGRSLAWFHRFLATQSTTSPAVA